MATSALRFESKRNVTNKTLYAQEQRKALCLSNSGNDDNTYKEISKQNAWDDIPFKWVTDRKGEKERKHLFKRQI